MDYWNIVSSNTGMAIDSTAICRLLNAIGSDDHTTLANAVLKLVSSHVAMADCSVLAFAAEGDSRIVSVASLTDERKIFHCASNYARHLFHHDRIQLHLQCILPHQDIGSITVHRQTLAQIIDAELRRLYKDTLEVVDSLAITIKTEPRKWITTHLCRHRDQGALSEEEIETIRQLAHLIATSASQHCRFAADGDGDSGFHTSVSDGIEALCSQLTQRERQVILRILDGVTVARIAGELGLKPTTVITYRSRAYEKIGIRSRRELFSAVMRNRNASSHWQRTTISGKHSLFTSHATSAGSDRPHQ